MKYQKRTTPIDRGYFTKDLFWWEGVYYEHHGDIMNDGVVMARIYEHNCDAIIAVTDVGTNFCHNTEDIDVIDLVETFTGF